MEWRYPYSLSELHLADWGMRVALFLGGTHPWGVARRGHGSYTTELEAESECPVVTTTHWLMQGARLKRPSGCLQSRIHNQLFASPRGDGNGQAPSPLQCGDGTGCPSSLPGKPSLLLICPSRSFRVVLHNILSTICQHQLLCASMNVSQNRYHPLFNHLALFSFHLHYKKLSYYPKSSQQKEDFVFLISIWDDLN